MKDKLLTKEMKLVADIKKYGLDRKDWVVSGNIANLRLLSMRVPGVSC